MELLEKHFETAFTAPDGIKKLRELILTLAMQGKLVPQDPSDQPASELLKEIEAEKKRLVREGKIKAPKPLPPIDPGEVPYEAPKGWKWVRLAEIGYYNGRDNVDSNSIHPDTWVLDLEDIERNTSRIVYRAKYSERQSKSSKSRFCRGDVLYGKLRPYLDKVVVADMDGVCTTEIVPIVPAGGINAQFLRWLLKRPAFLAYVNTLMYGVKMPRLGTSDAMNSIHPLPPIAEQHRIVAKTEELMARCDELERLGIVSERKRLEVHTAAISALLATQNKDDFGNAWQFITRHFSDLYSVKENVADLRKAILQLAVMGKLVPQDPSDQPASELLKEIEVEKKRLVKEGKIKAPKPLTPIDPDEVPYDLPKGWEWVRLGDVGEINPVNRPEREVDAGFVPMSCISADYGESHRFEVRKWSEICRGYTHFSDGDIGLAKITPCFENGKSCVFDGLPNGIGAGTTELHIFRNRFGGVQPQFVLLLLKSPDFRTSVIPKMTGTAGQKRVPTDVFSRTPLPLPPLPEQRRIVQKVDQLMALCDDLDTHISTATGKQTALLNAVMAQI